ncbi:hypothetical protein E4U55_007589 [Claviceps digitariae]|nr:hypothetical protein E4U55_007589 [Claviceps digitariae]
MTTAAASRSIGILASGSSYWADLMGPNRGSPNMANNSVVSGLALSSGHDLQTIQTHCFHFGFVEISAYISRGGIVPKTSFKPRKKTSDAHHGSSTDAYQTLHDLIHTEVGETGPRGRKVARGQRIMVGYKFRATR